jgi:hypothetical protein
LKNRSRKQKHDGIIVLYFGKKILNPKRKIHFSFTVFATQKPADVAQLVEQEYRKLQVASSSLVIGSKIP